MFSLPDDVFKALPLKALGVGLFSDLLDLAVEIVRHGFKHVHVFTFLVLTFRDFMLLRYGVPISSSSQ